MSWLDDDIPVRAKRRRGRPEMSPFPSDEVERDFVVRGGKMIEMYFDDSNPKSKNNFVFRPGKHMSKTTFWSMVYIYYLTDKHLNKNLEGFLAAVVRHFGSRVACDRASVVKRTGMLMGIGVMNKHHCDELTNVVLLVEREKYCPMYQAVVQLWESAE